MRTVWVVCLSVLFLCAGALAQSSAPADLGGPVMYFQQQVAPPEQGNVFYRTQEAAGARVNVFHLEMFDNGKPVTGAPYTATAVTETTQTLADGNRIVNKTSVMLARDSQGRTRREENISKVGPWAVNAPQFVSINDPSSQTGVVLDTTHQVVVSKRGKIFGPGPLPGEKVITSNGPDLTTLGQRKMIISDGQKIELSAAPEPGQVKTESLGSQTIEGVLAEGKRTTRTIPAGQIGNERPLEITSEVWFSPELQIIVLSKRNDPRTGETIYRLTDIKRVEPDHSLFEIPSGYTKGPAALPPPPTE
jgi:hypothetical protein